MNVHPVRKITRVLKVLYVGFYLILFLFLFLCARGLHG